MGKKCRIKEICEGMYTLTPQIWWGKNYDAEVFAEALVELSKTRRILSVVQCRRQVWSSPRLLVITEPR